MSFKKILKFGLASFAASAVFTACGDDSSSASTENTDSSSSISSYSSSSSLSTRADIDYRGEISINDTMKVNIELSKGDSSSIDSSETYIDSSVTSIPLYIGDLPKGSRIKVFASTNDIKDDKIQIRSEFGNQLKTLTAIPKSKDQKDSLYTNYFVPSLGSKDGAVFKDSNQFVVFSKNHYYLEILGKFTDDSNLRLLVQVDTAYYNFTGDEEEIEMNMTDTIRGIVSIDDAPDYISIGFTANDGYSINLTTSGKNVKKYQLNDGDNVLGSYTKNLDTLLVPNDSVNWTLKISTESFSNAYTGPYAFFEAKTKARALEKGEYFSNPDSIPYPGSVFKRTRPKDSPDSAIYRYNLRQEQFVWLGDYKKGDSLIVSHWISNYDDDKFTSPVILEILDQKQKRQVELSSVYGGALKIPADGPYYLHYLRLNSSPLDQVADSLRYVLQLFTQIQQPGLLKSMQFYDPQNDEYYKSIEASEGDLIRFNQFQFTSEPYKDKAWTYVGQDVSWFVPCKDLLKINNNYKISDCEADGKAEQEISSDYLVVQANAEGETARLIAESKADPSKRDTLEIEIIAKTAN